MKFFGENLLVKSKCKKVDSRRLRFFSKLFLLDNWRIDMVESLMSIFGKDLDSLYQFVHCHLFTHQVWLPGTYRIQLLQRRKICIFGLIQVPRR